MDYIDIYSVDREDYKTFVEQLNLNCFDREVVKLDKWALATKVISKKTNKCVCSRVEYEQRIEGQERDPEKYYIFCDPDPDERQEPVPKLQLKLESPQEVQALLELLKRAKEGTL